MSPTNNSSGRRSMQTCSRLSQAEKISSKLQTISFFSSLLPLPSFLNRSFAPLSSFRIDALKPFSAARGSVPVGHLALSDVLLKFLRAKDFKAKELLSMIKKCVRLRKEFEVDFVLEEDLGIDYETMVLAIWRRQGGRAVFYNSSR